LPCLVFDSVVTGEDAESLKLGYIQVIPEQRLPVSH
jgi:hypothetical protein